MKRRIEGPEPFDMSAEDAAKATAMIEQAEEDIADTEQRVNMRLGRPQLEVIKRAAKVYGVPYQTYVKEAAFRQALADLRQAGEVMGRENVAV
jgi:predicted DNA binding CopG/RHH family protein